MGCLQPQRTVMDCWAAMAREPGVQPPSALGTCGHVSAGLPPRLPRGPPPTDPAGSQAAHLCRPLSSGAAARPPTPGKAAATSNAAGPWRTSWSDTHFVYTCLQSGPDGEVLDSIQLHSSAWSQALHVPLEQRQRGGRGQGG